VFTTTWHADSLARLSDADIANAWQLADYLLFEESHFQHLEDVVLQRRARSNMANGLLAAIVGAESRLTKLQSRLDKLHELTYVPASLACIDLDDRALTIGVGTNRMGFWEKKNASELYSLLARGLAPPVNAFEMEICAAWGQIEAANTSLAKGSAVGFPEKDWWTANTARIAVDNGQLDMLKWLRSVGCPWGDDGTKGDVVRASQPQLLTP
jgi:hypothetical protein